MSRRRFGKVVSIALWAAIVVCISTDRQTVAAAEHKQSELTIRVGELDRTAIVAAPAELGDAPHPLVFVFHGHGGTASGSARRMAYHEHWPEAIVVYPQGVPTPGRLTDPEGKRNGWQHSVGEQGDRDFKFFDALLERLKTDYRIDARRIYSSGHSNGGGFTYLLWSERGDAFAAVGPSGAAAARIDLDGKLPKPVIHVAGENDPLVRFAWQKAMIDRVLKHNECEAEGKPAGKHCTEYPSKRGAPVVTFIHPGGHEFPRGAAERIMAFFKQHSLPATTK